MEDRLDRIEAVLQRLAERQEGLTQTVEIIAAMQKKNEEAIDKLLRSTKAMQQVAVKSAADFHMRLLALEESDG